MLVQQKGTHPETTMQSPETLAQLQQALEQISSISTSLSDIQLYYQKQVTKASTMIQKPNGLSFSMFISFALLTFAYRVL